MSKSYDDLLVELKKLRCLLVSDGDTNWVRGVDVVIDTLTSNDPAALEKAFNTYTAMSTGKESFADYFCWNDDRETMKQKNIELKMIKERIGKGFSACAQN